MYRRDFVVWLAIGGVLVALAAHGQPIAQRPRIGFLSPVWTRETNPILAGLLKGLRELGYVEGDTLAIEYRGAEGRAERLRELAAELVRLNVDVIVAVAAPAIQAAKEATPTIPIVMAFSSDPVHSGFVTTLARPGGNVTGLTLLTPDLSAKRLELLKSAFPAMSLVAVLANPRNEASPQQLREIQAAAQALKLRVQILEAWEPRQLRGAFSALPRTRAGLVVLSDPMLFAERRQIMELARKRRSPVVSDWREMAEAGGLIAYGPNLDHLAQRAATYVDKILKGSRPADLPVEQPTRFELVINVKTARALRLSIPQSLLLRADLIIE